MVNQRVRSVEITERALEAIAARLEYEPFVPATFAENDRESKLERHVETPHSSAETDTAEIVKGVPTAGQQLENARQASFSTWDFDRRARA